MSKYKLKLCPRPWCGIKIIYRDKKFWMLENEKFTYNVSNLYAAMHQVCAWDFLLEKMTEENVKVIKKFNARKKKPKNAIPMLAYSVFDIETASGQVRLWRNWIESQTNVLLGSSRKEGSHAKV